MSAARGIRLTRVGSTSVVAACVQRLLFGSGVAVWTSPQGRAQSLTSGARSRSQTATRLTCVERPVTAEQRSFDPSNLTCQVTVAVDIQGVPGHRPATSLDLPLSSQGRWFLAESRL